MGTKGMWRWLAWSYLVGTALAVGLGCSTPAAAPDAAPVDAGSISVDAVCSVPEGTGYIVTTMAIAPGDTGEDLDGDGEVDNMVGSMPDGVRASVNQQLQQMLYEGVILILYLTDWELPAATDPELTVYMLLGEDVDQPVDPSNNLGGQGVFWIPDRQFDLDCALLDPSDEAAMVDGTCSARAPDWEVPLQVGDGGQASFLDNRIRCVFDASFTSADCMIAGTLPLCSLSSVPFPGEIEGTFLDALINDASLSSTLSIDMDRDGDGLEQVLGDGLAVMQCVDGDGEVIRSRDCPCHPSIQDGYSYTLTFHVVPATVVGSRGT